MSLTADSRPADEELLADALALATDALDVAVVMASHIEGDDYTVVGVHDTVDSGVEVGVAFDTSDTFCHCVYDDEGVEVIDAVAADDRVAGLPAHEGMGLEAYIGVPLYSDGEFYGTLAVCDTEPRTFDEADRRNARTLGRLVETAL